MRHGLGTLTYPDTTKYICYWLNDKKHGKGQIKDKDEILYDAEWLDDE